MEAGLEALQRIREEVGVPVLTDVHDVSQVERVAEVVDVLQIPAFLCRQTDLIVAAAKSGRAVNVKKGQFLAPQDARNIVDKVREAGCEKLLLTERGATFWLQQSRRGHAFVPDNARFWRAGGVRRDPFLATAGRVGLCNWRTIGIHRTSRARRSRMRRGRGVHGSSRLSGESVVGRSERIAVEPASIAPVYAARYSSACWTTDLRHTAKL